MTKSRFIPLAFVTAVAAGVAGTAIAQSAGTNTAPTERSDAMELSAIESAKISLTDAIAMAEKEAGGKAVDAGFEDENGTFAYEVELLNANGEQKVLVDADTGKITQVAQNADEDGDQDDGDEGAEDEGSEDGEDND